MKEKDKIYTQFRSRRGQIAILIDPEETHTVSQLKEVVKRAKLGGIDYFFVGGSTVIPEVFQKTVHLLKLLTDIPLVIFPGDHQQISSEADALLYLSLISGRNPEYLIGQHVKSAKEVMNLGIEIMPTGYILMDGDNPSSVAYVSQTTPIPRHHTSIAINTATAGVLKGNKIIYFDAGSGAKQSVSPSLIKTLQKELDTVLIVGGGIRSIQAIKNLEDSGANVIVIGNKIEEDIDFLLDIRGYKGKAINRS